MRIVSTRLANRSPAGPRRVQVEMRNHRTHTARPRGEKPCRAARLLGGTSASGSGGLHFEESRTFQLAGASRGVAGTRRGRLRRRRRRRLGRRGYGRRSRWGRERRGIAGVLVHGHRIRGRGRSGRDHRLRPADAGLFPHPDGADDQGDPLRARPGGVEGRRPQHRLPGLRRRDRPGRQVGLRQVLHQRAGLREQPGRDRRHRHLQLGLCRDRDPGGEPGAERAARDGLAGEHVRLPDRGWARL